MDDLPSQCTHFVHKPSLNQIKLQRNYNTKT